MCVEASLHACLSLTGAFPVCLWGVQVPQVLVLLLQGWRPCSLGDSPPPQSAGARPGECSEKEIYRKKEFQWGMLQFLPTLAWKKTFSQVLIYWVNPQRLAWLPASTSFTAGICRAKLANYGSYWTKLSLFLVLIGWDDLIRLLYKSSLLENRGASYLQSNPGSKLGGSLFRVSATDISVGVPRIRTVVYCHYNEMKRSIGRKDTRLIGGLHR